MAIVRAVKFGAGFGKDTKYLDQRPCNEFVSAEWQKTHNSFFQRDSLTNTKFQDPRPPWFARTAESMEKNPLPPSPGRLGEWKLKWIPKEVCNNCGNRQVTQNGNKTVVRDSLYGPLVLRSTSTSSNQKLKGGICVSDETFETAQPRNLSTRSTQLRSKSSLETEHEIPDKYKSQTPPALEQSSLKLPFSVRSGKWSGSVGSSGTSCCFTRSEVSFSVSDTSAILERVKALEDALKGEKAMREKMQELLDNVGDRRMPGVSLPYLASSN